MRPAKAAAFDIAGNLVTTVPAASFEQVPVAPNSIVTAFTPDLGSAVVIAPPGTSLPTELGGTTVEVNGRRAGLFFVSPTQINYHMPAETVEGVADVVVRNGAKVFSGSVMIAKVAPAIFTANASGRGVPAANIVRVSNGQVKFEDLKQFSQVAGRFITKPIDMGPITDQVFLILYLSGVRQAALENVRVLIGGLEIGPPQVNYAGKVDGFVGLDQVNVLIPRSLIGRGIVGVSVAGLGYNSSNVVDIEIANPAGAAPPQVSGFVGTAALAGLPLTIIGTGFSPVKEENEVRIAGRLAEVMTATSTQLQVMVPFGVETGTISVKTLQGGEGRSATELPVRTSVSGIVENTLRQPLKGVTIKVADPPVSVLTNEDGSFVLPDMPGDKFHSIEVDGGSLNTTPPYPRVVIKPFVYKNRDNQYTPNIGLQQQTGGSVIIGSGAFAGSGSASSGESSPQSAEQTILIETDKFKLQFPSNVKILTEDGKTSAALTLTPLDNARTPVALPLGYYNSSIAQITPFNVKIDPGAKLTFPNTEGYPAGTSLRLFRYDQDAGKFVEENATVRVSADGNRIETGDNDIKVTSYYFASVFRNTTTIVGRVLESDGKTPVQRALARFRGQEAYTDGNGNYVLRYVSVNEKEFSVEISTLRGTARVDRVLTAAAQAMIGGITRMPDVMLPDVKSNRPPTIIAPPKLALKEGERLELPIRITDPDNDQISKAEPSGVDFATLTPPSPTSASPVYFLRLTPNFSQSGDYTLTITATDARGGVAMQNIAIAVTDVNQPPTAISQSVALDEDTSVAIRLDGTDPDRDRLTFRVVSQPTNGILSGDSPNLTYKPNLNFNGTDSFTFVANDGKADSARATVTITVRPINDPPVLTVPAAQTVNEGQLLSFVVSAFDPDTGQNLTITATGMPEGATFTLTSPTGGQFRWVPSFTQSGTYTVTFKAEDNGSPKLSDTKEVRITVTDVNLLTVPGTQTVNEGQPISFDVSAPTGLTLPVLITLTGKPDGADFPDSASNTGKFRWTPDFSQAGNYILTFKGTINLPAPITEIKTVQITVVDVVRDLNKELASYSVFGAAGTLPASSADEGDGLGTSLATGDLNGDGIADVAVGAPGVNGAGLNSGKVYVFFGRTNMTGSIDLAQDKADVEILGEAAEDHFGTSLAIGDLNGDGKADLAIGAPLADAANLPDAGKVYVVFGGLIAKTNDSVAKLAGATIIGSQRSLRLGTRLAVAGVTPKAQLAADLIVGAPGFDSVSGATTVNDVGAVFVFLGGATLSKTIDLAGTAAGYTMTGTLSGGEIGTTLAIGNFNGDNLMDFAVGGPLAAANGVKGSGIVYLTLGSDSLTGTKNASQAASLTLSGGAEDANLGTALAMGDLNGDGRADLIIGAAGVSGQGAPRAKVGAVYVTYGAVTLQNRPADLTIMGAGGAGDDVPDALGKTLAVGDFNGDNIADLAIGAPGVDPSDSKRPAVGAVYFLFGARTGLTGVHDLAVKTADYMVLGADSGDNLGGAAIAIANINASEPADLILGIPKGKSVNNSRTDAGEVRVIHGARR
ncbi:MAG TPA: Ig-like domain-containing protein [Blastocatellia bacterium]|nr:Ig-like domain-containing protein [Blastocatellia bacterium]HNG29246.1 Ig-like domain-containing protein [Blastocatellia bacterium]